MSAGLALMIMLATGTILVLLVGMILLIYRRRGQIGQLWLGDRFGAVYSVSIKHLIRRENGVDERSLMLVIAADGVFFELDAGDGSELLKEIYQGRSWIYGLPQKSEVE